MARILQRDVKGFVHDIDYLKTLSTEASNVRFLSDRTLYILNNLAGLDILFLTRYGSQFAEGSYVPVEEDTPDASVVTDTIYLVQGELTLTALEQITSIATSMATIAAQVKELQNCCAGSGQEEGPSNGQVSVGGANDTFSSLAEYFEAKCTTANAIFDTVLDVLETLEDSNINDWIDGSEGGVIGVAGTIIEIAGPLGWAIGKVKKAIVKIAMDLVGGDVFDWEDMQDALINKKTDIVRGIYNSGNAVAARASFMSALSGSTPSLSSEETEFIEGLLTNDLLNQLYNPRLDAYTYSPTSPVSCGSTLLEWDFVSSGEGWVFRDDSSGAGVATGIWSSGDEGWLLTMTPNGSKAKGTIVKTGLSQSVGAENSVSLDYSATSDARDATIRLKVIYSDATEDEGVVGSTSEAGTLTVQCSASKTISSLECSSGRASTSSNYEYSQVLERVSVQ